MAALIAVGLAAHAVPKHTHDHALVPKVHKQDAMMAFPTFPRAFAFETLSAASVQVDPSSLAGGAHEMMYVKGSSNLGAPPGMQYCYQLSFGAGGASTWYINQYTQLPLTSACSADTFPNPPNPSSSGPVYGIGATATLGANGLDVMYTGGSYCPPIGTGRSATLTMYEDPAATEVTAQVSEPSTCNYAIKITGPVGSIAAAEDPSPSPPSPSPPPQPTPPPPPPPLAVISNMNPNKTKEACVKCVAAQSETEQKQADLLDAADDNSAELAKVNDAEVGVKDAMKAETASLDAYQKSQQVIACCITLIACE